MRNHAKKQFFLYCKFIVSIVFIGLEISLITTTEIQRSSWAAKLSLQNTENRKKDPLHQSRLKNRKGNPPLTTEGCCCYHWVNKKLNTRSGTSHYLFSFLLLIIFVFVWGTKGVSTCYGKRGGMCFSSYH